MRGILLEMLPMISPGGQILNQRLVFRRTLLSSRVSWSDEPCPPSRLGRYNSSPGYPVPNLIPTLSLNLNRTGIHSEEEMATKVGIKNMIKKR